MQKSGYAGAREMSREIEHLYGFQKTAPDHLAPQTWQTVVDVFVKDKYRLGLRRFFQDQNPHARQTVLARLLEVDRQGIQRFSPADRRLLLNEYAHSVARDGAACNAQVCGNAVLRRHVANELRRDGETFEAADMESAFRRTLQRQPRGTTARKAVVPRALKVAEWRTLSRSAIAWVRQWPVVWNLKSIPWWVWAALVCTYMAVAGLLVRTRRHSVEALRLL